jgi:hypothetical protein
LRFLDEANEDCKEFVKIAATSPLLTASRSVDFARSFLRLANLSDGTLHRLRRYEAALWRLVGQTLLVLDTLDRRKPQERGDLRCMAVRRRGVFF